MKKLILLFFLLYTGSIFSQNLQLHYDFGKDRHYFTSTIEMFKPDEYGSTYFFVDMDYNRPGNKSVSLAYWEISRYINIPWVKNLSATVQYNDGMIASKVGDTEMDFPLGHVWLAGVSYPINLSFVTLNTDFLFRKDYLSLNSADAQITSVWLVPLFDGKLTLDGFIDIWRAKRDFKTDPSDNSLIENRVVVLTEPQIWLNLDHHLSVGSEVEISNNFIPYKNSVQVNPTLAAKWNF